ncbi:hypothetical protein BCR42DRAFT_432584 [Absidia repens]|uniref:Uncharacterized protein n=1 Tax=Absidia repens TaxID=90262 RepID=A0A1X2IZJ8_9FUNG|nr:hypothetical protein BCR42DRAFT_432584 [Absidia repens]
MDTSTKPSSRPVDPAPVGKDRVTALQHLGCTFNEGGQEVTKIATPTPTDNQEEEVIPTFMDPVNEENATYKSDNQH